MTLDVYTYAETTIFRGPLGDMALACGSDHTTYRSNHWHTLFIPICIALGSSNYYFNTPVGSGGAPVARAMFIVIHPNIRKKMRQMSRKATKILKIAWGGLPDPPADPEARLRRATFKILFE